MDRAVDFLSAELGALLPPVSASFWALLMVLGAVVFAPMAAARADRDFGKGIIMAIGFGAFLLFWKGEGEGIQGCLFHCIAVGSFLMPA